jgi:poly-gamma-glutamate synthesis protein (capsule biosynthesis protein)
MRHRWIVILAFALLAPCGPARAQWNYDIPFPKKLHPKPDTVTVSFLGDLMMHERQLGYDCDGFLSELSAVTRDPDISIANLEFSLAGKPYTGYPSFSAPDRYAFSIAESGVDVFLTANNHVLDKGRRGLIRTLGVYDSMRDSLGILYTGCAADPAADSLLNPLIIVGKGIRIALVNFTYENNYKPYSGWPAVRMMERDGVAQMFSRARERGADFIVALPHWGEEFKLRHSREQQEWAEWMVEQGADLIVGAHPHVVQDTSHVRGVPVIYSLGNAVSNMSAENTRLELAASVRFVHHPDGTMEMLEPELTFLWCCLPGMLRDNYVTIPVRNFSGRRDEWLDPSDYDNMTTTYNRVTKATGIYEENHQAGGH